MKFIVGNFVVNVQTFLYTYVINSLENTIELSHQFQYYNNVAIEFYLLNTIFASLKRG